MKIAELNRWNTSHGSTVYQLLSGRSNVFAVVTGKNFILVDTSVKKHQRELFELIDDLIGSGLDFKALVLTHSHFDHVENASDLIKKYTVDVFVHQSEAAYLKAGSSSEIRGTNFILRPITKWLKGPIAHFARYLPILPTQTFVDTLSLQSIGIDGYVLHTPGHSIGSSSIIVDSEIALVGDAMFGVSPRSIFPPFAVDTTLLVQSWEKLLDTKSRLFLPAHGSENTRELVEEQYQQMQFLTKK